jgi:hypothetical protein
MPTLCNILQFWNQLTKTGGWSAQLASERMSYGGAQYPFPLRGLGDR